MTAEGTPAAVSAQGWLQFSIKLTFRLPMDVRRHLFG
jgi:hypothetical protein